MYLKNLFKSFTKFALKPHWKNWNHTENFEIPDLMNPFAVICISTFFPHSTWVMHVAPCNMKIAFYGNSENIIFIHEMDHVVLFVQSPSLCQEVYAFTMTRTQDIFWITNHEHLHELFTCKIFYINGPNKLRNNERNLR